MGLEGEVETEEHHHDHEHEHGEENSDFQHPWVIEMFRQGFSFNGDERNPLFLGRGDGTFANFAGLSGADSPLDGRGLLVCDFDGDFDLDLFTHNIQRERHNLFRNERNLPSQGVKVRLAAKGGNLEGVGATVIARIGTRRIAQVMTRGNGYASSQVPELVFGLGDAAEMELTVRWPWGEKESFGMVKGGQAVLLEQGLGKARPIGTQRNPLPDPWPEGLRIAVGDRVPRFTLEGANGSRMVFDHEAIPAGTTLHLNLWASYCRPCVEEIPQLKALHEKEGHQVLGVSMDGGEARARALDLLRAHDVTYRSAFLLVDDDEAGKEIDAFLDLFRLVLPTTLEIDSDGRLLRVHQGRIEEVR